MENSTPPFPRHTTECCYSNPHVASVDRLSVLHNGQKGTPKAINIILNSNPKDSCNLKDLLARLTVDTAYEFLFENLNTLSERDEGEGSNRESGRLRVFRVLGHDESTR